MCYGPDREPTSDLRGASSSVMRRMSSIMGPLYRGGTIGFRMPMTRLASDEHRPVNHIQRCKERGGPVAIVVRE